MGKPSITPRVLIFPGAFQMVKNYGNYDGLDIWLKSCSIKEIPAARYYVGHSGGVNFILSHYDAIRNGKFIFVNPLIKKRSLLVLFWEWIKFFFGEGIPLRKLVPINNWPYGLRQILALLKVDVFDIIQKIPQKDLVVIRGKDDHYFCDERSAEIIRNNGIKLVEVDAGHDWNENVARAVEGLIGLNNR